MSERILVLQLKRIGDFVLTLPALDALRRARPKAEISVVVADAAGGLGALAHMADRVMVYRRGRPNIGIWLKVAAGGWDACLDFTGTDRSTALAAISRAKTKATYRKLAEKGEARGRVFDCLCDASVRELHTVDYHMELLKEIGVDADALRFEIVVPPTVEKGVGERLPEEEFVVVHPGTARAEKYWPADRWAAVVDCIVGHKKKVVITGGGDAEERAHIDRILEKAGSEVLDLAGKISLLELAEIVRRSRLVIGVDTAAMHLAALQERAQIVLYGPTNPYHWRPRHTGAQVLLAGEKEVCKSFIPRHQAAPMEELSADLVIRAIGTALGSDSVARS